MNSASDLPAQQKVSGIAPVTECSDKKDWGNWRWQCSIIPAALVEKALRDKPGDIVPFAEARSHFERDYLAQLLQITGGNVAAAAHMAKRNRTEFYRLLQRHKLEPALFKSAQVE